MVVSIAKLFYKLFEYVLKRLDYLPDQKVRITRLEVDEWYRQQFFLASPTVSVV
jgi:hypothetical protein